MTHENFQCWHLETVMVKIHLIAPKICPVKSKAQPVWNCGKILTQPICLSNLDPRVKTFEEIPRNSLNNMETRQRGKNKMTRQVVVGKSLPKTHIARLDVNNDKCHGFSKLAIFVIVGPWQTLVTNVHWLHGK